MLAALFVLGACGSSSKPAGGESTTTGASTVTYEPAGVNPSVSAKMVCEPEVSVDLSETLGVKATRITKPTWNDHRYSCTYVYPKGSFVLTVKELVDEKSTTAFFNAQRKKLGIKDELYGLGQGAFVANNDDLVVRKDYKVLVVDVQKLPKGTGAFVPAMSRSDIATNISSVIMSCWVGA